MAGTCLAGQLPGPAEPDAGTSRPCDIRVEGRSVSGLRPDSLLRCSALGGLLTQPLNVPADGEAGWCWPAAWPAAVRSRSAADLYALGQWSAAWSHLARSPRVVGPLGLGWGWTCPSACACLVLLLAPRSTADSRLCSPSAESSRTLRLLARGSVLESVGEVSEAGAG